MEVALVGRPNVGKSLLFNRLCEKALSITNEKPHTTQDYICCSFNEESVLLYDTVGMESMDFTTTCGEKILSCDRILYVVDTVIPLDKIMINYLNSKRKNVWVIVNKCDNDAKNIEKLPCEKCFFVSALHKKGIKELKVALGLGKREEYGLLVGILGKQDVGKSTILNTAIGYGRAGPSTRDSLVTKAPVRKERWRNLSFMDTAGYKNNEQDLDYVVSCRRHESLLACDGVIAVIDNRFSNLDKKIITEGLRYGKFMILCINKADLIEKERLVEILRNLNLPRRIPIVKTCAKDGKLGNLWITLFMCLESTENMIQLEGQRIEIPPLPLSNKDRKSVSVKSVLYNKGFFFYKCESELSEQSLKNLSRVIAKRLNLIGTRVVLRKA